MNVTNSTVPSRTSTPPSEFSRMMKNDSCPITHAPLTKSTKSTKKKNKTDTYIDNNTCNVKSKTEYYDTDRILSKWGFTDNTCHNCHKRNSDLHGLLMQCAKCKKAYYCGMKVRMMMMCVTINVWRCGVVMDGWMDGLIDWYMCVTSLFDLLLMFFHALICTGCCVCGLKEVSQFVLDSPFFHPFEINTFAIFKVFQWAFTGASKVLYHQGDIYGTQRESQSFTLWIWKRRTHYWNVYRIGYQNQFWSRRRRASHVGTRTDYESSHW